MTDISTLRAVETGWSGLEVVRPLSGGVRNTVMLGRRGGHTVVVRRSGRTRESLDWEIDLIEHLSGHGVRVPAVIPADDGRRFVPASEADSDGGPEAASGFFVVQVFLPGRPPRHHAELKDVLARVHELTRGHPQRPGFASARELLTVDRGGDVRLDLMDHEARDDIRAAWRALLASLPDDEPESAIHGDAGLGNALVDDDGTVGLIDWDEARVDLGAFDFAADEGVRPEVRDAGVAWETATCWVAEPEYAAVRLAELRRRRPRRSRR